MRKKLITGTLLVFALLQSFAQKYVDVTNEIITVNSKTAMSGSTRNIARISLPEKTIGYVYRVSIFKKGTANILNDLTTELQSIDPKIALVGSLMQLAIKNNDGNSVDAFVFNNTYDADNFSAKNDNSWTYCKSMLNRSNFCLNSKDCLNKELFFGFRNNNISQGLDVKLEVVAVVDENKAADYSYSYTILNDSKKELKYFISLDKVNWVEKAVREGYQATYTFDQPAAFFKIYTTTFNYVEYKIVPGERYKIIWNGTKNKWDLMRY